MLYTLGHACSDVVSWGSENHVNQMARLTDLKSTMCEYFTGYRLAAEVNRQHSESVCTIHALGAGRSESAALGECVYYTHTLRVLTIHFGRETVPSGVLGT